MKVEHKIITGLLFIIIIGGWLFLGHIGKQSAKIDGQASIIEEQQSHVTYHKNRYGEEYAKRITAEADRKTLEKVYGEEFDKIRKSLDINARAIKGLYRVSTETTGSGIGKVDTVYVQKDSIPSIESIIVSDSTDWFDINGVLDRRGFTYIYQTRDSITLVPYKDGKKTYVKGISANPNTKITGLQGILVHEEKPVKRFGIGPSIQVGYDSQIRITPGISIQWSLIRF